MRLIDADALMETIRAREYPLTDDPLSTYYGLSTDGIQQAVDEQPTISPDDVRGVGKWIPFETRPMDDEEREYWSTQLGYDIPEEETMCALAPTGLWKMALFCTRNQRTSAHTQKRKRRRNTTNDKTDQAKQ